MQQGGSPYEVTQYVGGAAGGRGHMMGIPGGPDLPTAQHPHSDQQQPLAEAASPISSRPPARSANFDELVPLAAGIGFPDDEALAGEETERGTTGNRWPRQETLALLKIRSEMDAAFRDATLKGPLWEDVSRKLAELGYNRSAKKCKEKFENLHKYHKRTREGRAGRQDGKSYRFFTQLEALHGNTSSTNSTSATTTTPVAAPTAAAPSPPAVVSTIHSAPIVSSGVMVSTTRMQPQPSSTTAAAAPIASSQPSRPTIPGPLILPRISADLSGGVSISSGGSSTSGDSSDGVQEQSHRKRKRSSESSTRKMMNFFEGLMKQVVEKQVALQQKFLETIEKREEDRMIREEAWKRQEMARLSRELDILAQERAMSASRDAAMIAFLQKFTGQAIHFSPPPQQPPPQPTAQPNSTTPHVTIQTIQQQPHHHNHHHQQPQPQPQPQLQPQQVETRPMPSSTDIIAHEQDPGSVALDVASSRWPKAEVLALIKLRSGLESRYQEAGPKGPLWEEISAEMCKLGYKRSSKRCKEKWENINKYFKKVKESNKKRPEDSKTCPYFHQLDALYRKKVLSSNPTKLDIESPHESSPPEHHSSGDVLAIMPAPISAAPPERKSGDGENGRGGDGGLAMQAKKSNNNNNGAGFYSNVVEEGNGAGGKKPEDIVKELMEQRQQHQAVMDMEEADSDNVEADDDEERDDEDDDVDDDDEMEDEREPSRPMTATYEAQYPRQGASASTGNTGSFITMVQ